MKKLNLNIKILISLWVLVIIFSFYVNDYKYQECFKIQSKIIEDYNYTDNKVNQDIRNYVLICEKKSYFKCITRRVLQFKNR